MARRVKLALIDAHALIHRAYHALPPMSTRAGVPTNAVFGFTSMLLKMFSTLKPTHVVAAFDVAGPTFRDKLFEAYKAHRPAADKELVSQFDLVRQVLQAFDIPVLAKKGFEADDIIGTLTTQLKGGVAKVIVTGDMDTLQLIDETTSIFTLKRGVTDTVLYDSAVVQERYGFGPEFIVDYKGLRGDPSDNIPGVTGIGEKTAKELVARYGSIEGIYRHLDELPARVQTRLKGHKKEALFSRRLAMIRRDVPIDFSLEEAVVAGYDSEKVRDVFSRLEFRSLLSRLPKGGSGLLPTLLDPRSSKRPVKHGGLPLHYHLVETEAEQQELRKLLAGERLIAFDTETDYLGAREYPIVGMSFAIRKGKKIKAWYVPAGPRTVVKWKELLENEGVKKVGHNLKYDIEVIKQSGVELKGIAFDSMIASYLLHPGARQYGLDTLAVQELNHHPIPLTDLIGEGKDQKHVSEVPVADLARYACEDAELTLRLYEVFAPRIRREGLTRVLAELELPLLPVLADLELAGVGVDTKRLEELRQKTAQRLTRLQKRIWEAAGGEFNINSTRQLGRVLYEALKLPTVNIARTQSGYSTAASELEKLRGSHSIIPVLEEYRELAKLQNTYIEVLPKLVDGKTGRIYASFNQVVAATGRLSSQDPNLQNIPVRTALGQEIRGAFVAAPGCRLVKADYSQIELRIAAHMSQDVKMIEAFRGGEDIHRATAAWVYGIKPEEVSDQQRREAKSLNFGVLYGMGAQSFARDAGISVEQARSFIGRYQDQYADLRQFLERTLEFAREHGFVETLFGRKRYLPEIRSNAPAIRSQAERMAFNFPIQGTAADILKKAMIGLHGKLAENFPQAKMVLTVHDELVVEAPAVAKAAAGRSAYKAEDVAQTMKEVMESVYVLDVPVVVEVAMGKNWKEMKMVA